MTILADPADTLPTEPSATKPRRRASKQTIRVAVVRLLAVVVVLVLWQNLAGGPQSFLPADAVSRPTEIGVEIWKLVTGGRIFPAFWATAYSALLGILIAAPIGIVLAVATSFRIGNWALEPVLTVAYAVPKVGLVSVYILLLGIKTSAHVAVVLGAVLFIFYYTIRQGFEDLDQGQLAALRLMGAGYVAVLRLHVLRSTIPHLVTAFRIALPHAFAVELFAELRIPTKTGLGVLVGNFTAFDNPAGAMAVLTFVVVIAYTLDLVSSGLLRRYTASIGLGIAR